MAQQHWLSKLLGYDFVIEYKPGKENKVVDALSRQVEDTNALLRQAVVGDMQTTTLSAISVPIPQWLDEVKATYQLSDHIQVLFQKYITNSLSHNWKMHDGILFYKNRIYLKSIWS